MIPETFNDDSSPQAEQDLSKLEFGVRFQRVFHELADKEYPATDKDLDQFRQRLEESGALSSPDIEETRQAALNNPVLLRQLFQTTQRTSEVVSRIGTDYL